MCKLSSSLCLYFKTCPHLPTTQPYLNLSVFNWIYFCYNHLFPDLVHFYICQQSSTGQNCSPSTISDLAHNYLYADLVHIYMYITSSLVQNGWTSNTSTVALNHLIAHLGRCYTYVRSSLVWNGWSSKTSNFTSNCHFTELVLVCIGPHQYIVQTGMHWNTSDFALYYIDLYICWSSLIWAFTTSEYDHLFGWSSHTPKFAFNHHFTNLVLVYICPQWYLVWPGIYWNTSDFVLYHIDLWIYWFIFLYAFVINHTCPT